MKRSLLAALSALTLVACGQKPAETPPPAMPFASAPSATLPPGHPAMNAANLPKNATELPKSMQTASLPPLTQKAQVLSTINASQFTYIEVTQDNTTRWLATTTSTAKKGDTISFDNGTVMNNFNSKVLNRTFPSITLVGRVVIDK